MKEAQANEGDLVLVKGETREAHPRQAEPTYTAGVVTAVNLRGRVIGMRVSSVYTDGVECKVEGRCRVASKDAFTTDVGFMVAHAPTFASLVEAQEYFQQYRRAS